MRLHTFIIKNDLSKNLICIEDINQINQIKNVFRLKKNDIIKLSNGNGIIAESKIIEINNNKIKCLILKKESILEQTKKTYLYLSILKKENFELAIQKAVECGVYSITPIKTKRVIKNNINTERLEKIIKEASEQCGQTYLPKLNNIIDFNKALNESKNIKRKIIFDSSGDTLKSNKKTKDICIFIGPEGGFTKEELTEALSYGFEEISLGSLTLRAETASIIGVYLAQNILN